MSNLPTIARNLIKTREVWKVSQNEMANMLGVMQSHISIWEHGKSTPSRGTLVALAALLGRTVDEIRSDNFDVPPRPAYLPVFAARIPKHLLADLGVSTESPFHRKALW